MILFYQTSQEIYAIGVNRALPGDDLDKLYWLFGQANRLETLVLDGFFVGPRKEMVTPWSTNAVEITVNMGISGIERIEVFHLAPADHSHYDPMLQALYPRLDQEIFTVGHKPDPIRKIENIQEYSEQEGLALSGEEINYLSELAIRLGRELTDSEVFGFSQVNS